MNRINMTGDTMPGQLGIIEASEKTMTAATDLMKESKITGELKNSIIKLVSNLNNQTSNRSDTEAGRNELRNSVAGFVEELTSYLHELERRDALTKGQLNDVYEGNDASLRNLTREYAKFAARKQALLNLLSTESLNMAKPSFDLESTDIDLIMSSPQLYIDLLGDFAKLVDDISRFNNVILFRNSIHNDTVGVIEDGSLTLTHAIQESLGEKEEEASNKAQSES